MCWARDGEIITYVYVDLVLGTYIPIGGREEERKRGRKKRKKREERISSPVFEEIKGFPFANHLGGTYDMVLESDAPLDESNKSREKLGGASTVVQASRKVDPPLGCSVAHLLVARARYSIGLSTLRNPLWSRGPFPASL